MAEKVDFASVAYILGILSIVFAFVTPVAGLILGIVGLVQSKRANSNRAKKLNIIGVVISVIFIIISIIALIYSAASGVTNIFPAI